MNVTFTTSQGVTLEGILSIPRAINPETDSPRLTRTAIVCHPHSLYGGTMHNKVVFRTGRALLELGMAVLRFNFRGTGKSGGTFDYGQGEMDDVAAAVAFMQQGFPTSRILVAGYSFGAWVGLRVGCQNDCIRDLVSIGTPVNTTDFSFLTVCRKPKLFIQGTHDEFGSVEQIQALMLTLPEPKDLILVDGAGHFFNSKLDALGQALIDSLKPRKF